MNEAPDNGVARRGAKWLPHEEQSGPVRSTESGQR